MTGASLTLGVEEEYLLVDPTTGAIATKPPAAFMKACKKALGDQVADEFLRSQVEVGTRVCQNITEVRQELCRLRRTVASIAGEFGLAPIATSTHPFAHWSDQEFTAKARYRGLARDIAGPARRMLICGMHVHAGIEDPDLRIDLMNQVAYFLPHLLALSTSSPFWQGDDTGLMSYRLTVFDALPRTGVPDRFDSHADFGRMVRQLAEAGIIEDASKIWWDIRPSNWFPTLEMRVTDVCTAIDDAVAIAALYQSVLAMLLRLRALNQRWRIYPATLVRENRWRAQRYGTDGALVDFGKGTLVPLAELIDELLSLVDEDAGRLGAREAVTHARVIAARGTSATRQRTIYGEARSAGAGEQEALKAVVDWLVRETVTGLDVVLSKGEQERER